MTLADSVGTLGVDLRTRVKRLGTKEIAREKKCKVRFSLTEKNKAALTRTDVGTHVNPFFEKE